MKDTLIDKLHKRDASRPRSLQAWVGPSEIGGCQRRLWYRINGTPKTNLTTLGLAASMGTAIHTMIENAFAGDGRYLIESEFKKDELVGHVDLIDTETHTVWDWKTTTKNSLSYFPSQQQIEQVQLYGYLANNNGVKVDQVGLVAIARDGSENDIREYLVDYDEAVALNALERYYGIKDSFEPPAPEKDADFCKLYCPFYGECTGIVNMNSEHPINNPEIESLVEDYKNLQILNKQTDAQMDFIKSMLEGTQGTTANGIVIKWAQVSGRQTTDEAEVQRLLGFIPKKQGNGYSRLSIK